MSRSLHVLLLEDNPADAELILHELRRAGYDPAWQRVETEQDFRAQLATAPEIILADYALPQFDALRALQIVQARGVDSPLIVLTGAVSEEAAVACMRQGAADYLLKDRLSRLGAAVERALSAHRLQVQQRQAQNQVRFQAHLLDTVGQAVIATTVEGTITYWNRAAEGHLGWTMEEVRGRHILDVTPPAQTREQRAQILVRLQHGEAWTGEVEMQRRDGGTCPMLTTVTPIRDEQGVVTGLVGVSADISERKQLEEALRHQALHDALTQLPNRILLQDRLAQALLSAQRDDTALALLLLDLDRFKDVNDTLGHADGDVLLQQVGARVSSVLRASDTVARLGGDEFAVLLPTVGTAGAMWGARKILTALATPFVLSGQHLVVGASIGMALYPDHGADAATLLRKADVAMYTAKRRGGGHAIYTAAEDRHSLSRLALVHELRTAIERNQLALYYQPKVHARQGYVSGVEALVRWPHPVHGLIPPDEFIPLAEHTGLIIPLTRWVLETALRQCRQWQCLHTPLNVAVNLSMRNLHDMELLDTVAGLLRQYAVAPEQVTLEITESALMVDPARIHAMLGRLAEMGVRLAIDDFGTGYSSLDYLKQLPVHELKIDKSFVLGLAARAKEEPQKDAAIVHSVIQLGHSLGLSVAVEGVENRVAWDLVGEMACDVIQGYYVSCPLPADELERWLQTSPWGKRRPRGQRRGHTPPRLAEKRQPEHTR